MPTKTPKVYPPTGCPIDDRSPDKRGASMIASLFPTLGLTTIDNTSLRYDPKTKGVVAFVAKDREGVEIAWDMCGACHLFISGCRCPNGPSEPPYIYRLRTGEAKPADAIKSPSSLTGNNPFVTKEEWKAARPITAAQQAAVDKRVREYYADKEGRPMPTAPEPRPSRVPLAPAMATPVVPKALVSPCANHTAESRLNADGTYTCTVAGCLGVV